MSYSKEGSPAADKAAFFNAEALAEFSLLAEKHQVSPVALTAGPRLHHHPYNRPAVDTVIGSAYILRPPTTETRYQKPQPGVACAKGKIFFFEPSPQRDVITLRHNCPAEGLDPATFDPLWFQTIVDAAETNIKRATPEGQEPLVTYNEWARVRQASGFLALSVAE